MPKMWCTNKLKRYKYNITLLLLSILILIISYITYTSKKQPIIVTQVNFSLDRYLYPIEEVTHIGNTSISIRFRVWKDILIEKRLKLENYDGPLYGINKLFNGKKLYLKTSMIEKDNLLYGSIMIGNRSLSSILEQKQK